MAFIVRRRTIGNADTLYRDLISNLGKVEQYEDTSEYMRDMELISVLSFWLRAEKRTELEEGESFGTEVDE